VFEPGVPLSAASARYEVKFNVVKSAKTRQLFTLAVASAVAFCTGSVAQAYDVSAPAMIQLFESKWTNLSRRSPDLFMAGYGQIWIPPASRADSGNQSVGYDVYDRFDLGNANNQTLYGTEGTLKRAVAEMRKAGLSTYADVIWNHNGFNTYQNTFFANAGGYEGFVAGDFHNTNIDVSVDQYNGRTSGLIDIAHEETNEFVRNPVPGAASNIPAGSIPQFGRLANVAKESNRRFYKDRTRPADRVVNGVPVWDYTADVATTGDPITENATGYLMRHAQWMVQEIGVDGFRLDATKHMPSWVLNDYFDPAVSGANRRLNLDGSVKNVFSFGENFDTNKSYLQSYVRKDDTATLNRDRDTKDFPLYYALEQNLKSNGLNNSWFNVVNASFDSHDDGMANNGSQGIGFVQSADSFGPDLSNVAHAFALMRPGNQIVYFNAKEFGGGRDFPKDGRGDALGGLYGDTITTLTNLRNTHGRGNYIERWLNKENLVYERDKSAVVGLSNRTDNGFDTVTVQTNFGAGTRLLEMTGNATDATVDPTNVIADYVVVSPTGTITFNVPRNKNVNGVSHGNGYVVYGLPTPQGTLSIPDKAFSVNGGTPTAGTNGTTRLASLDVVTGNSFTIQLETVPVVIGGVTDVFAGGDNAVFSINGGVKADGSGNDLNGNGLVDYRSPGSVVYGFEEFTGKKSPLFTGGDGEFLQTIDATKLVEGYNYLEIRAFRNRPGNEPPVYSSFKKVVYVDRFDPVTNFTGVVQGGGNDRAIRVDNIDGTADNVHVFLDTGSALTEAQTLALVGGGSQGEQIDTTLWQKWFGNVGTGNHTVSVVTYEPSGNYSVQRLTGLFIQTGRGLGLGDTNFDNAFTATDTSGTGGFETFLYSRGAQFNAASDINADGMIDNRDLLMLPSIYAGAGSTAALNGARSVMFRRVNVNGDAVANAADLDAMFDALVGGPADLWLYDMNVDGVYNQADIDTAVVDLIRTRYGDTNLNRTVDFADLLVLAQNYNQPGTWASGDFDGSGVIAFPDLLKLAQNYNFVGLTGDASAFDADFSAAFSADWALAQALVPEPTMMLALPVLALLRRRR
jgi:alpha-amylase